MILLFRPITALTLSAVLFIMPLMAYSKPSGEFSSPAHQDGSGVQWESWSDKVFERAQQEHKFVILDLEAVWCHWCHVMEEKTYHNPGVIQTLKSNYITVKVDQDSRPDLANRYQDYGWPATIIFAPDGTEIVKRAGFIQPEAMNRLLTAVVKDPSPEEPNTSEPTEVANQTPYLSAALKQDLETRYRKAFDPIYGSWGSGSHKFLDWDSVEYAITLAKTGDKDAEHMAQLTLDNQRNLLDPVWGGMYQYSTGGTWDHPHFEKIMSVQAENLKVYAQAYALWKRPEDLHTAEQILSFLNTFLKDPNGGYYTSMDADVIPGQHSETYFQLGDAARRAQGIPRVDSHQYARENGWVIEALSTLYMATEERAYLAQAVETAQWVLANRTLPEGGFRHDREDKAGPFLGDNVAMGRALLSLYQATGERRWLSEAEATSRYIDRTFKQNGTIGYSSAVNRSRQKAGSPIPKRDENAALARLANSLFHLTGNPEYKTLAENAMRFVALPAVAQEPFTSTALLPDWELTHQPTHITVVGHKDDPAAQALYQEALRYPVIYKRLDWWDKREGAMPNPDVQYPELDKPAAFVCTEKRCSLPVFTPEKLQPLVQRLTAPSTAQ